MDLTSNEPFWLIKNGLISTYPSLKENIVTDVLIVGSGISGSLMAHKCIEDGFTTVVIDRREAANGSTRATTSMLQYELDVSLFKLSKIMGKQEAEMNYWACYNSIDELGQIIKSIKSDCGFKKKDSLFFADRKKDVSDLKKEYEARLNCGLPVKWLSSADIEKKYKIHSTFGGILSKQGASMDAFRLTHDVLGYNQKKGLKVFDKTSLITTRYKKHNVVCTTDLGYTIEAKKIIYCTGYESTEMIKEKFVKLLSTYATVGECMENNQAELKDTLFWNTASPYLYMRTTDDNRLLIGGGDENFVDDEKRDALLNKKKLFLHKKIKQLLPNYTFTPDFVWAGTFGETKDGLPFIGKHPRFPHCYFLLGFGGNGITFSVIGTNLISAMLANKIHPLEKFYRFRR